MRGITLQTPMQKIIAGGLCGVAAGLAVVATGVGVVRAPATTPHTPEIVVTSAHQGQEGEPDPVLVFSSESVDGGDPLDLYMDFADARSRDMLLYVQDTLSKAVAWGKITVRVHPVVARDIYSLAAPVMLVQVAEQKPDAAWDAMLDAMRASTESTWGDPEETARRMSEIATSAGVPLTDAQLHDTAIAKWVMSDTGKDSQAPLATWRDRRATDITGIESMVTDAWGDE